MPRFCRGDMWSAYEDAGLFLITTNSTLKKSGALVMGRGIARQARDRFPKLDLARGREIARRCGNLGEYGLLVSPRWPAAKLGAFQVKTDFARPAFLSLMRQTVGKWARNDVEDFNKDVIAAFCEFFSCESGDLLVYEEVPERD